MITLNHIQSLQYIKEMQMAKTSLQEGYSGRSRVCARRAAIILLRAWMDSTQISYPNVDGYRLIQFALENAELPQNTTQILNHLVQRVDGSYNLPADINLLDDVNSLLEHLSINLVKY
jgi:hypothetical protein